MGIDIEKTCLVDERYDSYRMFFDHEWAARVLVKAQETPLYTAVFNLCEHWKGDANTARLPWLLIHSLSTFATEYTNADFPSLKLVDALANDLEQRIKPPLSHQQSACLRNGTRAINRKLRDTFNAHPLRPDSHQLWRDMLKATEFALAVMASQRTVFAALFFAYEDFVVACVKHVMKKTSYRVGKSTLDDLVSAVGATTAASAWTCQEITRIRLCRNAIAHNGARETRQLAGVTHGIRMCGDALQIWPEDCRLAFDVLKERAELLLDEILRRSAGAVTASQHVAAT